jgi:hypothetical protein
LTLHRLFPDHASEKKYLVRDSRGGFAFPQFQNDREGVLASQTISARYIVPRLTGLHTITRQLCQLGLDHAKFHHEGTEVLTQSRRGHGTFDAIIV